MRRMIRLLSLCFILISLGTGCMKTTNGIPTQAVVSEEIPTQEVVEAKTYINKEFRFTLRYTSDWIIDNEGYQRLTLVPATARSWQPSTPSEIPQDPYVVFEMGNYIRERMGPTYFPATVTPDIMREWLTQKVDNEEGQDFIETFINVVQAFEITEIYESDCERVVYWRPTSLEEMVRISTGCESAFLEEFSQIVNSLEQLE